MKNLFQFIGFILIILNTNLKAQNATPYFKVILNKTLLKTEIHTGRITGKPDKQVNYILDTSLFLKHEVFKLKIPYKVVDSSINIYYVLAKTSDQKIIVIFDKNFDFNFQNDPIIPIDAIKRENCNSINVDDVVSFSVKNLDTLPLFIVPHNCLGNFSMKSGDAFRDSFSIFIGSPIYYKGDLKLENNSYSFIVQNLFPRINLSDKRNLQFYFQKSFSAFNGNETIYSYNDTLKIGNQFFEIDSLPADGSFILLKQIVNDQNLQGFRTGFFSYDFHEKNLFSEEILSPYSLNNKYTLMEFWGTWCGPCMQLHDSIINFIQEHNYKIQYMGIAYDEDTIRVKNYLQNSPLLQRQIFVAQNDNNPQNLVDKFRIQNFPGFILLNAKGKIIFRDYGINGFNQLKKFIQNF